MKRKKVHQAQGYGWKYSHDRSECLKGSYPWMEPNANSQEAESCPVVVDWAHWFERLVWLTLIRGMSSAPLRLWKHNQPPAWWVLCSYKILLLAKSFGRVSRHYAQIWLASTPSQQDVELTSSIVIVYHWSPSPGCKKRNKSCIQVSKQPASLKYINSHADHPLKSRRVLIGWVIGRTSGGGLPAAWRVAINCYSCTSSVHVLRARLTFSNVGAKYKAFDDERSIPNTQTTKMIRIAPKMQSQIPLVMCQPSKALKYRSSDKVAAL